MATLTDRLKAINTKSIASAEVEQTVDTVLNSQLDSPTVAVIGTGDLLTMINNLRDMLNEQCPELALVSQQLSLVQSELVATDYICETLEPTDVGTLVKAICFKTKQQIIEDAAPKKKSRIKVATKAEANELSADDF